MKNHTKLVLIVDRSGSMSVMKTEAENAINNFIREQKQVPGEADLSLVLFDNEITKPISNLSLSLVSPEVVIQPRNSTALLDAIGHTINEVGRSLANMPEYDRPNKIVFVIMTDGEENSSRIFNSEQIRSMITHQSSKYNWQFIFLGANQDACLVAKSIGIINSSNFDANNVQHVYSAASCSVSTYRTTDDAKLVFEDQGLSSESKT